MLAAGPAQRHYNPDLKPVLDLLAGLRARAARCRRYVIDKPGFRLELRGGDRSERRRPCLNAPASPAPSQRRTPAPRSGCATVRGFVFDLDGTLVLGDRHNRGLVPLPGALEITRWVQGRGCRSWCSPTGPPRHRRSTARTLRGIGFELPDDAVLTPGQQRGGRAHPARAPPGAGARPRRPDRPAARRRPGGGPGAPPAGGPRGRTRCWRAGTRPSACPRSRRPATRCGPAPRCISCSQSVFFATAQGRAIGTSRAISAMIRSLTGCRVRLVGKPSLDALRTASSPARACAPPSWPWSATTRSSRCRWRTEGARWPWRWLRPGRRRLVPAPARGRAGRTCTCAVSTNCCRSANRRNRDRPPPCDHAEDLPPERRARLPDRARAR